MIRFVRNDLYGDPDSTRWPVRHMIATIDGGAEFGDAFKDAMRDELGVTVNVEFRTIASNMPNQNAITEGSNANIRNVLRRIAQANRAVTQDGSSKPWQSHWYGKQGHIFKQMVKLINKRIDASLGQEQPINVWNAYKSPGVAANAQIIAGSQATLIDNANLRREPSHLKKEKWFRPGQVVRRINDIYLKSDIKSNKLKQSGRWSDSLYKVYKVWPTTSAPPSYTLTLFKGRRPSDFKTRVNAAGDTVSVHKYAHDHLQLIIAEEETPTDLMDMEPDAPEDVDVGDRIEVVWVRATEPGEDEEMMILRGKMEQWVQSGRLESINQADLRDKRYYPGTVRSKQQDKLTIDFDDSASGEISTTNPTRDIFVSSDDWNKI